MSRPPRPSLPLLDGVRASCVATPPTPRGRAAPWGLLLDFLAQRFPQVSRADWLARLTRGEVFNEAGRPFAPQAPYPSGQRLFYYRGVAGEPPWPFDGAGAPPEGQEAVLHRDEHLLVVDKPHHMPVSPGGQWVQRSLLVRLQQRLGLGDLSPLHRLDLETAGVMLLSLNPASRGAYQALFRQRRVFKRYEAIAPWRPQQHPEGTWPLDLQLRLQESAAFMQMQVVPGEPNSHTRVDCLAVNPESGLARYALYPTTGRRHQLRAHMAGLGLPIVNDTLYPVLQPHQTEPDWSRPLQLLATDLEFDDPLTGQARAFQSQRQLALGVCLRA
jgi:tRNA pseudouridine32 synthase/23S rRNA pseudouridine746 synthase